MSHGCVNIDETPHISYSLYTEYLSNNTLVIKSLLIIIKTIVNDRFVRIRGLIDIYLHYSCLRYQPGFRTTFMQITQGRVVATTTPTT